MNKLKVYLNDVDITDICTVSDYDGIRVTLNPPAVLDNAMEPVNIFGINRTKHGQATVRYKVPRWIIESIETLFPGSFPDFKKPQTTQS